MIEGSDSITLTGTDIRALWSWQEFQKKAVEGETWVFDWPSKKEETEWRAKMIVLDLI